MYYKYSDYLSKKYGSKVYKLPVNINVTCPNRDGKKGTGGCIFCSAEGAGFEMLENTLSISKQLETNREYIGKKYKAEKFIAYFQNFTNTYLAADIFYDNLAEAAESENIVGITVSTRPDCVGDEHLKKASEIKEKYNVDITFELGLQTANYKTLEFLNRGHGLSEFIDAVLRIKKYGFYVGVHVILGLIGDDLRDVKETAKILSVLNVDNVKIHSLYILKNTVLGEMYEKGEIKPKSKDEYINEVIVFLENLKKDIAVQRLLGRAPEELTLFENWGNSWRKVHDEILCEMEKRNSYQGKGWIDYE